MMKDKSPSTSQPALVTPEDFEAFLLRALEQKYADYPPAIRETVMGTTAIVRWRITEFLDAYRKAGVFPEDRLPRLTTMLYDLKLQMYYIQEVDLGLYNQHVYGAAGYDPTDPLARPHLLLKRLSFDQNLMVKVRVLWERLMNFIYFLETGEELKGAGRKRSKRSAFFAFVKGSERWRFMEPYEPELHQFDSAFRSPELHKNSMLRPELFGKPSFDPNALLEPFNRVQNAIWDNIVSIVSGQKPRSFTDLHLLPPGVPRGKVDPRYL